MSLYTFTRAPTNYNNQSGLQKRHKAIAHDNAIHVPKHTSHRENRDTNVRIDSVQKSKKAGTDQNLSSIRPSIGTL